MNFGGQHSQSIVRRCRNLGVYAELIPYTTYRETIEEMNPRTIILSSGPSRYIYNALRAFLVEFETKNEKYTMTQGYKDWKPLNTSGSGILYPASAYVLVEICTVLRLAKHVHLKNVPR